MLREASIVTGCSLRPILLTFMKNIESYNYIAYYRGECRLPSFR